MILKFSGGIPLSDSLPIPTRKHGDSPGEKPICFFLFLK